MIKQKVGNLFEEINGGIILHGCNCQGVMGSGFAKQIKEKFPEAFTAYKHVHQVNGLRLGGVISVGNLPSLPSERSTSFRQNMNMRPDFIIVNGLTQHNYNRKGESNVHLNLDALKAVLYQTKIIAEETGLEVNMPLIGCGRAGGSWNIVSPIVEEVLGSVNTTVWVHRDGFETL